MKYVLTILLLVGLFSCNGTSEKKDKSMKDNYYTKTSSSWDASRIPLVIPYEVLKLNGSKEWIINLIEIPGSISNVEELTILNQNILVHSGETYCNNTKVKEAWFIIIPGKKLENCFNQKNDFDQYLKSLNLSAPQLHKIDKISEEFAQKKQITWE